MKKKPFYTSKTVIGALIVLVATLFPEIFTEVELNELVTLSTQLVGIILTVYGRIDANTKLTIK